MNEICSKMDQRRDSKISPWDIDHKLEQTYQVFQRRSHGKLSSENTTFRSKILTKPIRPHGLDLKIQDNTAVSATFYRNPLFLTHKTSMRLPPYIKDERMEEKPKSNLNLTQNIISFDVVRRSRRKKLTTEDLKRILINDSKCDSQILKASFAFLNKNFCLERRQSSKEREGFLVRRYNYRYDAIKSRVKTEEPR